MELEKLSSVSNIAAQSQPVLQTKAAAKPSAKSSVESKAAAGSGVSAKSTSKRSFRLADVYDRGKQFNAVVKHDDIGKGAKYNNSINSVYGGNDVNGIQGEEIEKTPERVINERGVNETLDKAIEEINERLAGSESECAYNVHKQTGIVSVKVLNSKTKEVIREIPPINRLDALAKMWELAGILIDKKG